MVDSTVNPAQVQDANSRLERIRLRDKSEAAFETFSLPEMHQCPSCPFDGSLRFSPELPTYAGKREINSAHAQMFI